jgi:hypothetical protein
MLLRIRQIWVIFPLSAMPIGTPEEPQQTDDLANSCTSTSAANVS